MKTKRFFHWFWFCFLLLGVLLPGLALAAPPAQSPPPREEKEGINSPAPEADGRDKGPARIAWLALPPEVRAKIDPRLIAELDGEIIPTHLASQATFAPQRSGDRSIDKTRFVVYLTAKTDLTTLATQPFTTLAARRTAVFNALRTTAQTSQAPLRTYLDGRRSAGQVSSYHSFFVFNGLAVEGDLASLLDLAKRPDVERIMANYPLVALAEPATAPPPAPPADLGGLPAANWNIDLIDAERVWNELGVTGVGAVVAGIDTGVDWRHPALQNKYRGYSLGGTNHNYNWFDPDPNLYPGGDLGPSRSTEPFDFGDHGTHTMGTMVGGGSTSGAQIGMAPGAKWIAISLNELSIMGSYADDIMAHKAFQWMLCPTDLSGSLASADCSKAPHVVNNSWGSSNPADDFLRPDITALRVAGIAPVFAAGNPSAGVGSIGSPGSAPEAITVGATDIDDNIAGFSGRGPSFYPGEQKPELSAPGVDVKSTIPGGGYANFSGTSMAAPHVAGLIALMVSADLQSGGRDLNVDELEYFLEYSAVDLGPAGPDNDYGWGRINALAAVRSTLSAGDLRGLVRRAATSQPIAGAVMRGVNPATVDTFRTLTSASGQYSVTVPAGTYDITIEAWGYNSATFAQQLVISGSISLKDFSLTPQPAAALTGQVLRGATPVVGAKIYVADHPTTSVTAGAGGNYSLTLPVGSHQLVVEAAGHRIKRQTVAVAGGGSSHNFSLASAPTILLVEADAYWGWFFGRPAHNFFQQSLDEQGYLYDKFSVTDPLELPTLTGYNLVIWIQTRGSPSSGGAEALLTNYLDGGGRLILSGQDIGYYDAGSNFFDNYLHATFLTDLAAGPGQSISGQSFLDGLSLTFNESDLYNYANSATALYPDAVAALDGQAYPAASYDNGAGAAILAVDPCGQNFRVVYFAAGYETLGPRGNKPAPDYAEVLARSINWVVQTKPARDVLLAPTTATQVGEQGATANYDLTVYNIGANADTYNLNLSSPWPAAINGGITTIGPLPACGSQNLTLTVNIPTGAPNNAANTTQLSVVSQAQPAVSASGQYRTTAFSYGGDWLIEPEPMAAGQFWTSAASTNNGIYVVGGTGGGGSVSDNLQFFNGQTWTPLASKPTALMGVGLAAIGNKLYAAGGFDDSFAGRTELEIYDIAANSWSAGPALPVATGGAAAAAANGKLYLFGGASDDSFFSSMTNETWEFNPANGQWTQKSDFPGQERAFASAVTLNGLIYLVGGWGSSVAELNDVYAYNPSNNTWATLARLDEPRQGLGLTVLEGQLYAIGGTNDWWSNLLSSVERYDPASDTWFDAPALNIPRGGLAGGVIGERIFAMGGQEGSGAALEPGPVESLNFGPDLQKTVNQTTAQPGETLNYTLSLQNGALAHPVSLQDVLPAGLTFAGFTQNPSGATYANGVVSWNGNLAAQQSVELAFDATVANQGWSLGQVITNVATLAYDTTTIRASALTRLDFPDFSASLKTVDKALALAGETLTYTIHIQNPSLFSGPVQVQDGLPANTTYVPGSFAYTLGSGSGEAYLVANQAFTWSATLPAAGTYTNSTADYQFGDSRGEGVVMIDYNWVEIAPPAGGTGALISFLFSDDDYFYPLTLPFAFNFYGTNYTNLAVATNGTIYFENSYLGYINEPIPASNFDGVDRFIAHFWDDLFIAPGNVYYQIVGAAPNRRLIVEYYQISRLGSPDFGTWEIILYENGDVILFQYQDLNFGNNFYDYGASATVGIQSDPSTGLEYSFDQPALADELAMVFLPPDASFPGLLREAEITLAAVTNGSLTTNTWITNTANINGAGQSFARRASTRINPVILSQSSKTVNPSIVGPGEPVRYAFELRNDGLVATTAILTDPLPASLAYVPGSVTCDGGATCSESGGVVHWSDILAAGEVRTLAFSTTLTANLPDLTPVVNQATLRDDAGGTSILTATFTARRGHLGSSFKTVAPANVEPGDIVTYTIYVRNNSPVEVGGALTDTLPAGLTYVNNSLVCGVGTCQVNNGRITWNGTVPGQSLIPVRFLARVRPTVANGTIITNTARIVHLGEASYDVGVGLSVNNSFKAVAPASVAPGGLVTYTVYVRNNLPTVAGAVMTDTLPAGLAYVNNSLVCGVGVCNANNGRIRWSGVVSSERAVSIRFQAQVSPTVAINTVITNTAHISQTGQGIYQVVAGLLISQVGPGPGNIIYLPTIFKNTP